MKLLQLSHERETYDVVLQHSLLFECALGLAAATYHEIHPSLEKDTSYWANARHSLSLDMQVQLDYLERNNTWKTLLQLLHADDFSDLESFLGFIRSLSDIELLYHSYPYVGKKQEALRKKAASGDADAIDQLVERCRDHKFFPAYLRFLQQVDPGELREHLLAVMEGWYQTHVLPEQEELAVILACDLAAKKHMQQKLASEQFVEWATGGIRYVPEPSVTRVVLIPHVTYRPWNIQSDCVGTKIFYYPVADDSLTETPDLYAPPLRLTGAYKALGDEHRLRLVKHLYHRDYTLQELTEKLSLAKSTVHHHLMLLRSARLVTTEGTAYRLEKQPLELLANDLLAFLQKEQSEGPDDDANA
ncbi:ArsR family transcriptional regulator [Brevibacillus fluminis]|uniref:ArsR family transcriptional regulator n=1 Tax=Brevibacillus fluminis TaxID=511487 RepID=A0A3M8DTF2_9BACL|nr:ArsR family transcriptional regulator [Brevibacillus fluminis]RNB91463.1 ArsR family transcriptional regulator [Brevibacillus fluminis]